MKRTSSVCALYGFVLHNPFLICRCLTLTMSEHRRILYIRTWVIGVAWPATVEEKFKSQSLPPFCRSVRFCEVFCSMKIVGR